MKIGMDAGGGFFKVCISVLVEDENTCGVKKRLCYEDGIAAKKFKSGSVKKLIILAIAPGLNETYDNISKVLMLLKLDKIPRLPNVKYAADLKMINLLLGLMSAALCHPCAFCDIDR